MTEPQEVNTPFIAVLGLISAILVFAIIVLLMVIFNRVQSQQEYAKDISQPETEAANLTAKQQEELASYGWVDQDKGTVRIPITRAMRLVVDQLAHEQAAGEDSPRSAEEEGSDGN